MKKIIVLFLLCLISQTTKTLVLSGNASSARLQHIIARNTNPDGLLDSTFAKNGVFTTTALEFITTYYVPIRGIALQLDGKIVAVGSTYHGGNYNFTAFRFMPDGSLDTTFGIDGIVVIENSLSGATIIADTATSVGIQSDGKIIVGGATIDNSYNTHYAVVRLLSNGTLDPSFGVGGPSPVSGATYIAASITGYPTPFDDYPNKLIIQADDKIIMGGYSQVYFGMEETFTMGIARFTAEGQLDATFGSGGPATFPGVSFVPDNIVATGGNGQVLQALAIQSDGRIIAGGAASGDQSYFALVRFTTEGLLDATFAQGQPGNVPGTTYINGPLSPGSTDDEICEIALDQNDTILAGGYSTDDATFSYFAFAKFTPNGVLDSSFGIGSTHLIPGTFYIPGPLAGGSGTFYDSCQSIALQNDGALIGVGYSSSGYNQTNYRCVAIRILPEGILDQAFGSNGVNVIAQELIAGQTNSYLETVALQSNRDVVTMGWTGDNTNPPYLTLLRFFNPSDNNAYQQSYTPVGAGIIC